MTVAICQASMVPKENNAKVLISHVRDKATHFTQPKVLNLHDYIKKRCGSKCKDPDTEWLEVAVKKASKEHDVPEKLIYSVIAVESNFNKAAKSGNQYGLMQIVLSLHKNKFKGKGLYDTTNNVNVGTIILKECADKHNGNIKKTLHCYNGGGDPRYEDKVTKTIAELHRLKKQF